MKKEFRILVVLSAGFLVAIELVSWLYVPSDIVLADFLLADGYGAIFIAPLPIYIFLTLARLLTLYGLYTFHEKARALFVALTVVTISLATIQGFRVIPPIQIVLGYPAALIDGALIVLAYFGPVSKEFESEKLAA